MENRTAWVFKVKRQEMGPVCSKLALTSQLWAPCQEGTLGSVAKGDMWCRDMCHLGCAVVLSLELQDSQAGPEFPSPYLTCCGLTPVTGRFQLGLSPLC